MCVCTVGEGIQAPTATRIARSCSPPRYLERVWFFMARPCRVTYSPEGGDVVERSPWQMGSAVGTSRWIVCGGSSRNPWPVAVSLFYCGVTCSRWLQVLGTRQAPWSPFLMHAQTCVRSSCSEEWTQIPGSTIFAPFWTLPLEGGRGPCGKTRRLPHAIFGPVRLHTGQAQRRNVIMQACILAVLGATPLAPPWCGYRLPHSPCGQ